MTVATLTRGSPPPARVRRQSRRASAAPAAQDGRRAAGGRRSPWVALFLLTLLVPFYFYVGSLQLTPYRVVLLAVTGPLVLSWLMGGAGKIRIADIAIFLYCGWAALSFSLVHDIRTGIESGGILFAETIGAYLIGRVFIRDADSFHAACVWMLRIVLLLLPFAIIEAVTARNLVLEIANAIGPSNHTVNKEPRWGLDRAQGPFPHPILFGVFCGVILTLTYFVLGYGRSWVRRVSQAGLVFVTGSLSLSSGPMSAIAAQCLLIGYDGTMQFIRQRWILLLLAVISMTLLIAIISLSRKQRRTTGSTSGHTARLPSSTIRSSGSGSTSGSGPRG